MTMSKSKLWLVIAGLEFLLIGEFADRAVSGRSPLGSTWAWALSASWALCTCCSLFAAWIARTKLEAPDGQ